MKLKARDGNWKPQSAENVRRAEWLLAHEAETYASAGRKFKVSRERMRKIVYRYCQRHFLWSEWLDDDGKPHKLKQLQKLFDEVFLIKKLKLRTGNQTKDCHAPV